MVRFLISTIIIIISFVSSQDVDCVGSSITRNGYPFYTDSLMKANGYSWNVNNFGVPGAGVVQNAYKDKPEYEIVVDRKSEIVIILLGANDWIWYSTASKIERNKWENDYKFLVNEFMKNSRIFLGLLIYRVNGEEANKTMDILNSVIIRIANEYGFSTIDFKSAIGTDPAHFWVSDGLHPNNLGSKLMGIAAFNALEREVALSIDEEYWSDVKDYNDQKRVGWWGCQP